MVFPISAFVAAGFEHSIANMYLMPLAMLVQQPGAAVVTFGGMFTNLAVVIAGNLVGGSVLVALVYWTIYLRPGAAPSDTPRP